jgi:hypothetical protein
LAVVSAIAAVLALTSPWSADERRQLGSRPQVDPQELSRDLIGGEARHTECKVHRRQRVCELEGPTGKRAICFLGGSPRRPELPLRRVTGSKGDDERVAVLEQFEVLAQHADRV